MTRMMTLDKEYAVEAIAYFPVSITYYLFAENDEQADKKFQELIDQGKFNQSYFENKPGTPEIEVIEIKLFSTNQER